MKLRSSYSGHFPYRGIIDELTNGLKRIPSRYHRQKYYAYLLESLEAEFGADELASVSDLLEQRTANERW